MKGRDLTTKRMDQVDRTVLGTVGSCVLKSIVFDFNNIALQRSTTFNVSLQVLIRIKDQDSFSFFWVGNYITDYPMCSPVGSDSDIQIGSPFLRKKYMNALAFNVHYVETPFY